MKKPDATTDPASILAQGQGAFYLATGVWPLVSMRTFEAVTGPKADRWLVNAVGTIVGVIGGTLIAAGLRRRVTPEIEFLAIGSAAALAAIDITYVSRERIPPVYLLDAAAELALVAGWSIVRTGERPTPATGR